MRELPSALSTRLKRIPQAKTSTAGQIAQDQVGSLAPKQKGDHRDPVVSMIFWHLSIVKHGKHPTQTAAEAPLVPIGPRCAVETLPLRASTAAPGPRSAVRSSMQ